MMMAKEQNLGGRKLPHKRGPQNELEEEGRRGKKKAKPTLSPLFVMLLALLCTLVYCTLVNKWGERGRGLRKPKGPPVYE